MDEFIGNLFDYEDEGAILAIPITVAFKHGGDLAMDKGYQKKASVWYPALPIKLGRWYREHSREIYFASMENVLAFPVKMSLKEITNERFVEFSFKKVKSHLDNSLFNNTIYLPVYDPVYEDVDSLGLAREIFHDLKNLVIVRDIQL